MRTNFLGTPWISSGGPADPSYSFKSVPHFDRADHHTLQGPVGDLEQVTKRVLKPSGQQSVAGSAYEQYHAELHRFLMRRLHSSHQAQDLAQEAYLRLLRVERAELVRQPRAYLYRIAVNLVTEFRLRSRRDPVTYDSDTLADATDQLAETPADETERTADAEQIKLILDQLPPLYRAIFVLRKRDGLSYQEIAQQLEISVHTVKKYLARAVAQCRHARWSQ